MDYRIMRGMARVHSWQAPSARYWIEKKIRYRWTRVLMPGVRRKWQAEYDSWGDEQAARNALELIRLHDKLIVVLTVVDEAKAQKKAQKKRKKAAPRSRAIHLPNEVQT